MSDIAISMYDLVSEPEFKQAMQDNNQRKMDELLYSVGVDVNIPYEYVVCNHRPLRLGNQSWYGARLEATERRDPEWLKSGNASWEAIMEYDCSPELRVELKVMGQRNSPTENAMIHAKNDKPDII